MSVWKGDEINFVICKFSVKASFNYMLTSNNPSLFTFNTMHNSKMLPNTFHFSGFTNSKC